LVCIPPGPGRRSLDPLLTEEFCTSAQVFQSGRRRLTKYQRSRPMFVMAKLRKVGAQSVRASCCWNQQAYLRTYNGNLSKLWVPPDRRTFDEVLVLSRRGVLAKPWLQVNSMNIQPCQLHQPIVTLSHPLYTLLTCSSTYRKSSIPSQSQHDGPFLHVATGCKHRFAFFAVYVQHNVSDWGPLILQVPLAALGEAIRSLEAPI